MTRVWKNTTCIGHSLDSIATIECFRALPMEELLSAQLSTASQAPSSNLGDEWLPVVDGPGGFLPAAPSQLIQEGRFGSVNAIIGWCDDDAALFIPPTVAIEPDGTRALFKGYLPAFSDDNLDRLLELYPLDDFDSTFFANGTIELPASIYRAARILRDILFTCQPIYYGGALSAAGNQVYFYDQNQTMLSPLLHEAGLYGAGAVHGSELGYVFGNLSIFSSGVLGISYNLTHADIELRNQESRSWSSFAALGQPSLRAHETLQGWLPADFSDPNYGVYVIGGPNGGNSGSVDSSSQARAAMKAEKLKERCGFLNSAEIIKELQY